MFADLEYYQNINIQMNRMRITPQVLDTYRGKDNWMRFSHDTVWKV